MSNVHGQACESMGFQKYREQRRHTLKLVSRHAMAVERPAPVILHCWTDSSWCDGSLGAIIVDEDVGMFDGCKQLAGKHTSAAAGDLASRCGPAADIEASGTEAVGEPVGAGCEAPAGDASGATRFHCEIAPMPTGTSWWSSTCTCSSKLEVETMVPFSLGTAIG